MKKKILPVLLTVTLLFQAAFLSLPASAQKPAAAVTSAVNGMSVSTAASVTGTRNETVIYDWLVNAMGCNTATASGILANLYYESQFNPLKTYREKDGRTSFGLCQWNSARLSAMRTFCAARGLDSNSVEGQLRFLQHELESSESNAWAKIQGLPNTAEGAAAASYNWARYFERCASSSFDTRTDLADTYWKTYSAAPAVMNVGNSPLGRLDLAEGGEGTVTVSGWAFDDDDTSACLTIRILLDGKQIGTLTADTRRFDVDEKYSIGCYHGFGATLETDQVGSFVLEVHAVNIGKGGNDVLLGKQTVTITQKPAPGTEVNAAKAAPISEEKSEEESEDRSAAWFPGIGLNLALDALNWEFLI